MKIITLQKAVHGLAVYAEYKAEGHSMRVYLYHNKPCTKERGEFKIICHQTVTRKSVIKQKAPMVFYNYADFRLFRNSLVTKNNLG